MYELVNDFSHEIFNEKEGPFLSLYQPTYRDPSHAEENRIRFKNLLKQLEASLKKKFPDSDVDPIMKPFYEIREDRSFWDHTKDGLAVFATPKHTVVFKTQSPVKEIAMVGKTSFHTKPMIRLLETQDEYHVLAIGREKFELYDCVKDVCDRVEIDSEIPTTKEEAIGTFEEDPTLNYGAYQGDGPTPGFHGHDDIKGVLEKDIERFFRHADKVVYDNYSKPTEKPLILCTLPEYQSFFQENSRNTQLVKEGVKRSENMIDAKRLGREAWAIFKPKYEARINELINSYNNASTKGLGSDNLEAIAENIIKGNIETILVESEKTVPGRIDRDSGRIIKGEPDHPDYDDVLDDIAQLVQKQGGEVHVLDADKMPTNKGLAAIYRFKA